jgi:hypothetical protein
VSLETHIDDVVNLIQWEELSDVVLCGHSYFGCVVSVMLDRSDELTGSCLMLFKRSRSPRDRFVHRFRLKLAPRRQWEEP